VADLYYIDSDYFTPDAGYYVYIANAEATINSSATVTCVIGLLQSVSATASANFTPTLTVEVLKNHTALIDAVVTMSTVAVVNRSITQTLDSIANLDAMADRTRDYSASISSASTLSALVGKIQTAESTQSSTASLTAVGGYRKQISSSISSTAGLTARAFKSYERPQMLKQTVGTVSIDTTNKKFGSGSLTWNGTSRYLEYYFGEQFPLNYGQGLVIDFWAANFTSSGTASILQIGSETEYLEFIINNSEFLGVQQIGAGGSTKGLGLNSNCNVSGSTFRHIRLISQDTDSSTTSIAALYVDGTRVSLGGNNSNYSVYSKTLLRVGNDSAVSSSGNIDDLRILSYSYDNGSLHAAGYNPTSSTQTVPSAQFQNDDTATNILLHFNGDFLDDVSGIRLASATLSTTATLSASAIVSKVASATLSSLASLTAGIQVLKEATATASSESTLAVDIIRIREATAVLESAATVSALVGVIKQFASIELSAFDTNAICQAQLAGVALLESFVTLSATARKTVDGVHSLSSAFTLSAIPTTTSGASADLSITATVTADNTRVRYFDATLSSSASTSVDATKYREFAATLSSEFTQTTAIDHFVGFIVLNAGSFSLTADANRTRDVSSTQASTATLSANVTRIQTALAALSSSATVSATAAVTTDTIINLTALATSSITAVKTANAIPVLDSIATQLTVAVKNATGTITLQSTASLTALVGVIKQLESLNTFGLTGVQLYSGPLARLGPVGTGIYDDDLQIQRNTVISFWMQRNGNTYLDSPQTILGAPNEGPNNTRLVINYTYNGSLSVYENAIRFDYYAGGGGARWVFDNSFDTEWHHFLLRCKEKTPNPQPFWDLWVDGVYIGERQNNILDGAPRISGEYLNLGYQTPYGADPDIASLDGSLAQIWIGDTNQSVYPYYTFNVNDYYNNGLVDFGADGREYSILPPPAIYNPLTDPWTNVNFVEYTTQTKSAVEPINYPGARSNFILIATPVAVLLVTANLSSTTAITINAVKQVAAGASLSTVASLTATANTFTGVIANLTSTASVSATATRIQTATANLSSTATIAAIIGQFEQAQAALTSTATLVCEATEILPISGSADLSSAFTLTADAQAFSGVASTMEVFATLSVDITVKPPIRIDATLVSTATLTVIVGAIEQFAVLAASAGTMLATATRIQTSAVAMNSVSNLTASITRTRGFTAALNSQGFVLTTGTIINIDPYLTLVVAPESRYYYVLPENRVRIVESETRVNIV